MFEPVGVNFEIKPVKLPPRLVRWPAFVKKSREYVMPAT